MRRLVAALLAVFLLAFPSASIAQSAGDEQYTDPFGQTGEQDGSGDEQGGDSQDQPVAEPEETLAPAEEPVVAAQESGEGTLPRTGLPALVLAAAGGALLAGGLGLRRRVS